MRVPVIVGGLSALELQGYGQYVPMGKLRQVYFYSLAARAREPAAPHTASGLPDTLPWQGQFLVRVFG